VSERLPLTTTLPRDVLDELGRLRALNRVLTEEVRQLQGALESRVVIEQAKGILAERFGMTIDESFELLRTTARTHRMKLRALAAWVVASPETPPLVASQLRRRLDRSA
jgi:AmiR/NasT family two-component response regulator